ncbi:MAG: AAA family ATPase [Alphaproteobacteria bacterium]|nr:AAA family ATPase [Alphaproteobacteria bacterium]
MTKQARLIIVCGLPGAGKTTHAKKLAGELSAIRFCPDEWMEKLGINLYDETTRSKIETLQWEIAQAVLQAGGTAIIEWGTWGRSERDTLRLRARELGASVELHYLTAPIEELYKRVQLRGKEDPPIRKEDLIAWGKIFQPPDATEIKLYDNPNSLTL